MKTRLPEDNELRHLLYQAREHMQTELFRYLSEKAVGEFKKQIEPVLTQIAEQLVCREVEAMMNRNFMGREIRFSFTFNEERALKE